MVEDAVALMDRLVPSEATEWSSYVNVVISFRVTFKNSTFSFRLTRTRPSMPNANVQVERPFQNRRLREHIGRFTAWCDLRVSGRCLLYTDFTRQRFATSMCSGDFAPFGMQTPPTSNTTQMTEIFLISAHKLDASNLIVL